MNAAPISPTPCAKNDKSFSLVNTPGDTILSAILSPYYLINNLVITTINITKSLKPTIITLNH